MGFSINNGWHWRVTRGQKIVSGEDGEIVPFISAGLGDGEARDPCGDAPQAYCENRAPV